jgi:hypothetical protein
MRKFDILSGKAISENLPIVDLGVELEILKKACSWISYKTLGGTYLDKVEKMRAYS